MKTDQGFIKWIIIVLIAIIVLGYYGFDIRKAIEAPATQNNLTYVQQVVSNVWHNYLEKPVKYLWGIFIKYTWDLIFNRVKSDAQKAINNTVGTSQIATSSSP